MHLALHNYWHTLWPS